MPSPSPLNWLPDAAMSIEQAVERANALLAAATSPQPDGRVRPMLDRRTIRYYQTLGIVPPPRRAGGRRAVYRSTHLVRAVMTKLRQAAGARLSDIATGLNTRSDEELWQQVGDLLQSGPASATRAPSGLPASGGSDRQAYAPERSMQPPSTTQSAGTSGRSRREPRAVTILPGVHLLIEATASQDPDELLAAMRTFLARMDKP